MKHKVGSPPHGLGGGLGLLLLLLAAGCAGQGTVSGTVSYKHKPIKQGRVSFQTGSGRVLSGDIMDGEYTVAGIPPGPTKISVWTPGPPPAMPVRMPKGVPQVPGGPDPSAYSGTTDRSKHVQIPAKYNQTDSSGLTYTVTTGAQTFPIDLE